MSRARFRRDARFESGWDTRSGATAPARLARGSAPMRAALERRLDVGPGVPSPVPIVHGRACSSLPLGAGAKRSAGNPVNFSSQRRGGSRRGPVSCWASAPCRRAFGGGAAPSIRRSCSRSGFRGVVSAFSNALALCRQWNGRWQSTSGEQSRAARTLMNELEACPIHFGDIARLAERDRADGRGCAVRVPERRSAAATVPP